MIKIDEIDFFAFEGCSESEFTELLGKNQQVIIIG